MSVRLSVETVEEEKDWAQKRFRIFMSELNEAKDPLEIEVKLYQLYITAKRAYTVAHLINGKVKIEKGES